jgi:hypothetical protein
MAKEILKLRKGLIRAQFDVSTFNEKERTVDVTFATETLDVQRYDWRACVMFIEQLVCDADSMRLDRLNASAPFLDNHISWGSVRDGLGKVVPGSVKVAGKKGRCTVQFSAREAVKDVMQDVKDGILENISVGYNVYAYERQPYVDGETPIYRAIDWEPYEVSLVNIPADIGAGVNRSIDQVKGKEDDAREFEVEITDASGIQTGNRSGNPQNQPKTNNLKTQNMKDLEKRALAVGLPATATEAEVIAEERKAELIRRAIAVGLLPEAKEADIVEAERKLKEKTEGDVTQKAEEAAHARYTEITKLVRTHKMTQEFGDELIADKNITIDAARKKIMDKLAEGDAGINGGVQVVGSDEMEKLRTGIQASIILRSGAIDAKLLTKEEIALGAQFRHHSLLDLAKESLTRAKIDYKGLDKMEIAKRAITSHSSDFPVLLEGTNRRVLLASYAAAPDKWREFCAIGSVGDFREYKRVRPGAFTILDEILENEEYKNKEIPDGVSNGVSVKTFGNTINVSRKMIVNDDLGAFVNLAAGLGRAAKRSIEVAVFKFLLQNGGYGPTMKDSLPLFDAAHNNIVTGAGITMAQFDKIRIAIGSFMDEQEEDYLDLEAAIWLGPLSLRGTADSINGSEFDPDANTKLNKPNIVRNMFKKTIGTPRLPGSLITYAFADPSVHPVIEVSFLDGIEAPYMESHVPFNVDGIQWKVRMDYGIDAVETRGAILSTGA